MALNLKKFKHGDIVQYTWIDTNTAAGWFHYEPHTLVGTTVIESVGIFVEVTDDKHFCTCWSKQGKSMNDSHYIPLAMMRSVKKIGGISG